MIADSAADIAALIRASVPDTRHRPRVRPAPGLAGRLLPFRSQRGVRNDWAKRRARGARIAAGSRMPFGTRRPCAFQHTGRSNSSLSRTGHRTQVSPAFRTRMGFSACSMSPGIATLAGACLVRANCCPDMHLGRPPAWSASTACRLADPRLPPVIRKPSGPTAQRPPHPAPHYGDGHDAPLIGTGRSTEYSYLGGKSTIVWHAAWTNLWRNLW